MTAKVGYLTVECTTINNNIEHYAKISRYSYKQSILFLLFLCPLYTQSLRIAFFVPETPLVIKYCHQTHCKFFIRKSTLFPGDIATDDWFARELESS